MQRRQKNVTEFEASNERHPPFCERRRISLHSFRDWLYRLRRERSGGTVARSATKALQMVPVRIRLTSPVVAADDIVVHVRGAVMRVRIGQDPRYIAELMAEQERVN